MSKKLYRSSRDKIFGGVCGGIADYFNVDVSFVRIITALAIVLSAFSGLIVYIISVFIVPMDTFRSEDYNNYSNNSHMYDRNLIFLGGALIVIGGFSLLRVLFHINGALLFACALIIAGAAILYKNRGGKNG